MTDTREIAREIVDDIFSTREHMTREYAERAIAVALTASHASGAREGIEKAARLAESGPVDNPYTADRLSYGREIAAAIRALSKGGDLHGE